MGLAGGLVKRVFSKSRSSAGGHDGNRKNFGGEKSKWSSVRLYICGDEFNSHPEDDLASSEGSEATVMQPVAEGSGEESSLVGKVEDLEELVIKDSSTELFVRLNAAIHIQSAFRGFLARQQYEWIRQLAKEDQTEGLENASRMSEAISTEVQIGDSTENLRAEEQSIIVHHRLLNKSRSQVYRVKEEWDDSTVDSNIKKLRLQNRLEATTRRERALAYAFSQQLRICPTKKRLSGSDSTEPNMGWTWLERWMATRMLENPLVDDCLSKHLEPMSGERKSMIIRKGFDVAVLEKESCGSNDVSVNFDGFSTLSETPADGYGPVRNRLKVAEDVSRRRSLPDYHNMTRLKVSKRALREAPKGKGNKQVQQKVMDETESKVLADHHQTADIADVNNY